MQANVQGSSQALNSGQQQSGEQQQLFPMMEPGQHQGLWSGQVQQGFDHPMLQQQQFQQQHLQQQMQQQLLLGAHGNLAPLVGQQISQLSNLVGGPGGAGQGGQQPQQQTPPGLHSSLSLMLGAGGQYQPVYQQAGQQVQSPPAASSSGFLLMPGQAAPDRAGLSPSSTPGPAPTPPMQGFGLADERPNLFQQQGDMNQQVEAVSDQMMAWRGLQGGTLADMFPQHPTEQARQLTGWQAAAAGQPGGQPGQGGQPAFNGFTLAAMAQQENMMRLQQLQQARGQVEFLSKHNQLGQIHQYQQQQQAQPPHFLPQQQGGTGDVPAGTPHRFSGHFQPPQCPSPVNSFSLPPGPRPRPVGGDSSPPVYTPDNVTPTAHPPPIKEQAPPANKEQDQLIIGSWNEEVAAGNNSSQEQDQERQGLGEAPPGFVQDLSQPPPCKEWGGTFQMPKGGGQVWGQQESGGKQWGSESKEEPAAQKEATGEQRGGRGKRGGNRGGRGGNFNRGGGRVTETRSEGELLQERAAGKNSAIEETKAMMAKMREEEKQMLSKYRKENGIPEEEEPKVQPGAYRPRERRGRDDRKDGQRGRGGAGRGRGRGGPPMQPGGPMGPLHPPAMFGGPPFHGIPSDFRTPPFPGVEGFLPPPPPGQFPPGFPANFAAGFPPGFFPGGFPGELARGRGGFNRGGRGFPVGFPPRGFPPPIIGARGRGGRFHHPDPTFFMAQGKSGEIEDQGNPLLSAIEKDGETEDNVDDLATEEQEIAESVVVAQD